MAASPKRNTILSNSEELGNSGESSPPAAQAGQAPSGPEIAPQAEQAPSGPVIAPQAGQASSGPVADAVQGPLFPVLAQKRRLSIMQVLHHVLMCSWVQL